LVSVIVMITSPLVFGHSDALPQLLRNFAKTLIVCLLWALMAWKVPGQILVRPQLSGMTYRNNVVQFLLNGDVGATYVIQVSSNLLNWLPLSTNAISIGGSVVIIDLGMTNHPRRFYRAVPETTDGTVYVAADGSDSNLGTSNAPLATLNAAASKLNGIGTILMLPGYYYSNRLNGALVNNMTVQALGDVRVFLGQELSAFVPVGNGIYSCPVNTNAYKPSVLGSPQATMGMWVFEWGTTETNTYILPALRHALEGDQSYRLPDFYRITNAPRGVASLKNGQFCIANSTCYLKFSDGGAPNGRVIWVPNSTASNSVCYNGQPYTRLTFAGIKVYFGYQGFDCSHMGCFEADDCGSFGNLDCGVEGTDQNGSTRLIRMESGANCNCGLAYVSNIPTNRYTLREEDCWVHDNGREGSASHYPGANLTILGGLYEYNFHNAVEPFGGATISAAYSTIRYNNVGVQTEGASYTYGGATNVPDLFVGKGLEIISNNWGCAASSGTGYILDDCYFDSTLFDSVNAAGTNRNSFPAIAIWRNCSRKGNCPLCLNSFAYTPPAISESWIEHGTATLSRGTVTVSGINEINSSSLVFLTRSGTTNSAYVAVSSIRVPTNNDGGFTISSSSTNDNGTINWMIYQP